VSNTPFRYYKRWVHEGGIATPLIAHWPAGGIAPGISRLKHGFESVGASTDRAFVPMNTGLSRI
jgi:arylsulfatase